MFNFTLRIHLNFQRETLVWTNWKYRKVQHLSTKPEDIRPLLGRVSLDSPEHPDDQKCADNLVNHSYRLDSIQKCLIRTSFMHLSCFCPGCSGRIAVGPDADVVAWNPTETPTCWSARRCTPLHTRLAQLITKLLKTLNLLSQKIRYNSSKND